MWEVIRTWLSTDLTKWRGGGGGELLGDTTLGGLFDASGGVGRGEDTHETEWPERAEMFDKAGRAEPPPAARTPAAVFGLGDGLGVRGRKKCI